MSVQNQTPFNSYTANGATTVFPFTFLLLESGDLVVEADGAVQSTGFTVSGIGAPAGGSVTFTVAPANGVKVLLKRVLTLQRLTDYQNNGDLLAATLNKDFDRIWQSLQQLQQNDIRALKLPFDTAADQVIPEDAAARANKGVKFDASGNLILSNFDPDGAQESAASAVSAAQDAALAAQAAAVAAQAAAVAAEGIVDSFGNGGVLDIEFGGTGASTASSARANLGLGSAAVLDTSQIAEYVQGTPAGAVAHFAMTSAPTGWLKANGAAISRTTYAELFAAIGTTFGVGDGSATFNLPDLRGEFLRGWDDGRGVDAGRALGSAQLDAMQGHKHMQRGDRTQSYWAGVDNATLAQSDVRESIVKTGSPVSDGTNGTPRTAGETRSRNVAMLACIKF